MRNLIALALCAFSAPTLAANYCPDEELPWFVAEIPHGYAIVRMAYSDFCKQDHMSDDPAFICDGRDDYRLYFDLKGKTLTVRNDKGLLAEAEECKVDFSNMLGPN
ncbi:hypothetical protein [Aquamicrobium defluvii]|uniref:Uncharacterized protein n=1 Tax=Aquamicrobium defluvii TaxID=69279 RepID=A0A011TDF9_9HYPH|nr:hypothetical protein [Aquamicrobium defluvii]EXL09704.1 hypothetical protein BG36_20790 [Aquamicrobium defluvii]EZQ16511.1 hypothetical protein CF98_40935 [Halopseudomonas bauzanensis]